jgi:DNA (cytosine-5)-methyltransferase 1
MKMRAPTLRLSEDEAIGDGFAGGGGASLGIEWATGRKVDVAINHDPEAIAMHEANHPDAEHYIEDIFDVDPLYVARGRKFGLMWFSPDCTEFSGAKNGSIKRDRKVRCLADVVPRWAAAIRPRVIVVENVEEFLGWGPLDDDDRIIKARKGEYFRAWWSRMEDLGYKGECRILRACDYGAPTSRKRAYIVWRCDGADIGWPDVTHGPGYATPWRSAAECIDYSIPCPSIFMDAQEATELYRATGIKCKRPLVDNTLARIGRGMWEHVIRQSDPFIIPVTHPRDERVYDIHDPFRTVTGANRGEFAFVAPGLVQTGYGERPGQKPRCLDLHQPLGTIISGGTGGNGKHALVAAFLSKHYSEREGGWNGSSSLATPFGAVTSRDHHALTTSLLMKLKGTSPEHLNASIHHPMAPLHTIAANGNHHAEVRAFLTRYNGQSTGQDLRLPFSTLDCNDRFGLVNVAGELYEIGDIGMRMLIARELYRANGFPDSYIIDPLFDYRYVTPSGRVRVVRKPLTETSQTEKCGNAVVPHVAMGIIRANFPLTAAEVGYPQHMAA